MSSGIWKFLSPQTANTKSKLREKEKQLPPVESLEPRLCLGSMQAGLTDWSRTSAPAPAEIRLLDTGRTDLENLDPVGLTEQVTADETNASERIIRNKSSLRKTTATVAAPTQLAVSDFESTELTGSSTRTDLTSALQANLQAVLQRVAATASDDRLPVAEQSAQSVSPQSPSEISDSTPAQNDLGSNTASQSNTNKVNFQHRTASQSQLNDQDLADVGLERDAKGNAIGFSIAEVAKKSSYKAWWLAADQPVVIGYDFRGIDGNPNVISEQQQQLTEQVLNQWSEATDRKIVFQRDTTSAESRIINIGVGDLANVGHVSGEGAVLSLGGGQVTQEGDQYVANGVVWLDAAEKWDNEIGNGNPTGTFDFSTVVAHELGHALGMDDLHDAKGNAMDGTYQGEQGAEAIKQAVERGRFSRTVVSAEFAAAIELHPMTTGSPQLHASEVQQLLARAAAASASQDAIIAVVDRNGRILGVRVEADVLAAIPDQATLVFAIDGAVAKARTAAMFSNGDPVNGTLAPITSRTIRTLSQSTITQREVESNPNVDNGSLAQALASTRRGPGFVAPIGVGGHFPQEINFTPLVDLFGIEHTNRDTTLHPGADGIKGTADDISFTERFNADPNFVPTGKSLFAPESYGSNQNSGRLPDAQGRGIATLPGGIPLFRDTDGNGMGDTLVGGIGVFFPGSDGYATHEQGFIPGIGQTEVQRTNAARVLEAEYIAFVAAGGSLTAAQQEITGAKPGAIGGVAPIAGLDLPFGRLDLVGIQLDVFGPMGSRLGLEMLLAAGQTYGVGSQTSGQDQLVDGTTNANYREGLAAPGGWLVTPHDAADGSVTAADVEKIINNAILGATLTRAAIRLPVSSSTRMVFAVTDTNGELLGLYRMRDATTFSIDVAVAKARNTAYYADANDLQAIDQLDGVDAGTAFTNRTFRFLSQPRFPSGINGTEPAPFSIVHDGNINQLNGENLGAPATVGEFVDSTPDANPSVYGFDSFFPNTNFRDPGDGVNPTGSPDPYHTGHDTIANQNGIVFFPGSTPIYKNGRLIGGFGVSGDGVDQDDVVTYVGATGFLPESHGVLRADQTFVREIRLPYQKFLRNPFGGLC